MKIASYRHHALRSSFGFFSHPRLAEFSGRALAKLALIPALLAALLSALPGNAQTATWTAAGNMSAARVGHTATLLKDGTVLVAGGGDNASLASAEIYDPNTNSWTVTGSMSYARSGHTATLLSDGRVLVVGGDSSEATAEIYDPSTRTWVVTGSLNTPRAAQSASLLQNGMVLVAGGCCTTATPPGYTQPVNVALTSSELWNPTTGQWTFSGDMVNAHANHTATVLSNGSVLVAAGTSFQFPPGPETESASEIYNPASGSWTAVGSLATARYSHTASLLINNQVLVAGGDAGGCCSGLSSAELYNPSTQAWQAAPAMSTGRNYLAAAVLPGNTEALVSGGYSCCSSPNSTVASAEIFNITTQSWSLTASMNQARYNHTLTTLGDGSVLAVGGTVSNGGSSSTLASAERFYNGSAPPQVTITSNVATMDFTVTGTGCSAGSYITPSTLTWTAGASCTVMVSPPSGYVFDDWNDGSTANPRTFVAPSTATTYSFTVTITAGNPASISAAAGTPQSTTVGSAFASPLVVTVKDSNGNPVSGVIVTFTAPGSGASGTFAGSVNTARTNASGMASSAVFTANATAGTYTVTAKVAGVSRSARFTLTNQAAGAASITASGGTPQSTTVGTAFASLLVVTVQNSSGNPVSGVSVTFLAPGSGASGTFAGGVNTATTNSSGVATSAVFTANITAGSYTVSASVAGVSTPASFVLTNTAGKAASVTATSGTPQSAVISTAFSSPLVVTVDDSDGNPVSGVSVTFLAPANGASGTFAGGVNTATTNSAGVATSAVFTANAMTGSYTVGASVAGVSTSANFALTNTTGKPASVIASSGTPQSAAVNTAFASPLVVAVKDSNGNPISGVSVTFTPPAGGASGTFAGGVNTATTNSSGVASSAVFTANATAGSYSVTASVAGVSTPATFALTNTAIGGQSTTITLVPSSYVTTLGTTGGQAVGSSIDLLDESGTQNTWNKYVEFDGLYAGYQVFSLPTSIAPSSVTNIQIQVNYQGPSTSTQTWTWQIYNWVSGAYVTVGTNIGAPDWGAWKILTFNVPGILPNYVRASDGQVRLQLVSNNAADNADIDYEAVIVTY
ncbi:MAG TPA: kelch repeat-containing protein [Terriglobales bacterium]|nr:kelch repeat-containing protein [Terriglobales bacterium]